MDFTPTISPSWISSRSWRLIWQIIWWANFGPANFCKTLFTGGTCQSIFKSASKKLEVLSKKHAKVVAIVELDTRIGTKDMVRLPIHILLTWTGLLCFGSLSSQQNQKIQRVHMRFNDFVFSGVIDFIFSKCK